MEEGYERPVIGSEFLHDLLEPGVLLGCELGLEDWRARSLSFGAWRGRI
jgi:hypothetical protein